MRDPCGGPRGGLGSARQRKIVHAVIYRGGARRFGEESIAGAWRKEAGLALRGPRLGTEGTSSLINNLPVKQCIFVKNSLLIHG